MAKILLVEDDNNLREIYEARLQAEGYDIVSAPDGEAALVVAKKEMPDLVVSDVMMPRISGFEMLDIMRNTEGLKHVKVIMLTALGQAEEKARGDKLGADKYLVKSQVTLEDIVKAVDELLNGGGAALPQTPVTPADETSTQAANAPQSVAPAEPASPQTTGAPVSPQPQTEAEPMDVQPVPASAAPLAEPVQAAPAEEPTPAETTPPLDNLQMAQTEDEPQQLPKVSISPSGEIQSSQPQPEAQPMPLATPPEETAQTEAATVAPQPATPVRNEAVQRPIFAPDAPAMPAANAPAPAATATAAFDQSAQAQQQTAANPFAANNPTPDFAQTQPAQPQADASQPVPEPPAQPAASAPEPSQTPTPAAQPLAQTPPAEPSSNTTNQPIAQTNSDEQIIAEAVQNLMNGTETDQPAQTLNPEPSQPAAQTSLATEQTAPNENLAAGATAQPNTAAPENPTLTAAPDHTTPTQSSEATNPAAPAEATPSPAPVQSEQAEAPSAPSAPPVQPAPETPEAAAAATAPQPSESPTQTPLADITSDVANQPLPQADAPSPEPMDSSDTATLPVNPAYQSVPTAPESTTTNEPTQTQPAPTLEPPAETSPPAQPEPQPAQPAPEQINNAANEDPRTKRVIKPLEPGSNSLAPDIKELAAKEGHLIDPEPPHPLKNISPHQPGHVISPIPTDQSGQPEDPNKISL